MTNEILIVDDEDRIRRLLKLYLERESLKHMKQEMVKKHINLLWKMTMRAFFRLNVARNGRYRSSHSIKRA